MLKEKTFPKSVCMACTDHKCCRYGQYLTEEEYNKLHAFYGRSMKYDEVKRMVTPLKKPHKGYMYEIKAKNGNCYFYNTTTKKCGILEDSTSADTDYIVQDLRPILCRLIPLAPNNGKLNFNRSKEWCSQPDSTASGSAVIEYMHEIEQFLETQPQTLKVYEPKAIIQLEPVNLVEESPVTSIGTSIDEIVELLKNDLEQLAVKK